MTDAQIRAALARATLEIEKPNATTRSIRLALFNGVEPTAEQWKELISPAYLAWITAHKEQLLSLADAADAKRPPPKITVTRSY